MICPWKVSSVGSAGTSSNSSFLQLATSSTAYDSMSTVMISVGDLRGNAKILLPAKSKGGWEEGDGTENVISCCIGNGRNTVSRVLFRRRELTEFWGKLGEFCVWHTNNRLRGTH